MDALAKLEAALPDIPEGGASVEWARERFSCGDTAARKILREGVEEGLLVRIQDGKRHVWTPADRPDTPASPAGRPDDVFLALGLASQALEALDRFRRSVNGARKIFPIFAVDVEVALARVQALADVCKRSR